MPSIYYEIDEITEQLTGLAELANNEAGNHNIPAGQRTLNLYIENLKDELMNKDDRELDDLIGVLDWIGSSLATGGISSSTLWTIGDFIVKLEDVIDQL